MSPTSIATLARRNRVSVVQRLVTQSFFIRDETIFPVPTHSQSAEKFRHPLDTRPPTSGEASEPAALGGEKGRVVKRRRK